MNATEILKALQDLHRKCELPDTCELGIRTGKEHSNYMISVGSWEGPDKANFVCGVSRDNIDDAIADWRRKLPPTGFALAQKLRAQADQIEKEAANETR